MVFSLFTRDASRAVVWVRRLDMTEGEPELAASITDVRAAAPSLAEDHTMLPELDASF